MHIPSAARAGLMVAVLAQMNYLTDRDMAWVVKYMPVYKDAADCVGVPVLALPAIHVRESDLCGCRGDKACRMALRNIGGPFMLDCGANGDRDRFDANIRAMETLVAKELLLSPVPRVRDDFRFACVVAAWELKEKARGMFWDRHGKVDTEVLADAVWGYNGRLQKSWRRSAYVNNHPLAGRRLPMRATMVGGGVTEYLDSRPGVMVLYREMSRRFQ